MNSSAPPAGHLPASIPTWRYMLAHPARIIAFGFGSGLAPFAPGTFGTLFGWFAFTLIDPTLSDTQWLALIVAGFIAGVFACELVGRELGAADHGSIVWDEIIAIWLVLLFTPGSLVWQACAFALFRLFDILKPPPIRYFDRKWKNGFGVMWDDLVAAFLALIVVAVTVRITQGW